MRQVWPVKKAIVNLPIRLKENSKRISGNSLSPLGAHNQVISAVSQTFKTGLRLRLRHRLRMLQHPITLTRKYSRKSVIKHLRIWGQLHCTVYFNQKIVAFLIIIIKEIKGDVKNQP